MAMDPFGNYQVAWATPPAPLAGSLGLVLNGTGAPASSLGSNGYLYVDLATGNVYQKTRGTWALIGGGGGGGGGFSGTGSPVGVVTPTQAGQSYVDLTNVPGVHVWFSTGTTSSSWDQIV